MENDMPRYSAVEDVNPREIVLLKSKPCVWGKCTFCDYILDNDEDEEKIIGINKRVLENVRSIYSKLEVINSGSCFEIPKQTLNNIKEVVDKYKIQHLFFESHYMYKDKLEEFKKFFGVKITFKCGIETFDSNFRNSVLKKGVNFQSPKEVAKYFESICLMVGIKGQTKEMIRNDIKILLENFKYGCINIYIDNTTKIKSDKELIKWFLKEFEYLKEKENIAVLVNKGNSKK